MIEKILREIRAKQPVGVVSVTHLNNTYAKVFCLEMERTGPIAKFQEGIVFFFFL